VYVPLNEPRPAWTRVTEMLVIPAAGPGATHVPDMSVLEGVVGSGPHDPSSRLANPGARRRLDKEESFTYRKSSP